MVFFTLSFAAFGHLVDRLLIAGKQLAAERETIALQVVALREAQNRLVQAEKLASLGRMAASVAHEVRNPLGVIRSSASLLAEGLADGDEDAAVATRFIVDEVDRLDGYVGRILSYAAPLVPEQRELRLAEVVERAGTLAGPHLDGVELVVQGEAPVVRGDAELLVRAVLGMLVNAAQAGAKRVEAVLGGAGEAVLELRDDGGGVPPQHRAQLFEPFFTTKAKGTGLGLALARRIAEAHGGTLELVDGPQTCLRLSLPTQEAP
jgi:two-component system sensor histidine kinase HydH